MPESAFDGEAFRQFELAGWTEVAARYQSTFGQLTDLSETPEFDCCRPGLRDWHDVSAAQTQQFEADRNRW